MPRRLNGTADHDTLLGDAGADIIRGLDGNDLIYGDGLKGPFPAIFPYPASGIPIAANTIIGGAGDDTIYAGYGADQADGGIGDDLIIGYGVLADGNPIRSAQARDSDGADVLIGGDGKDTILGGGGNDLLRGGAGDDVLVGGVGADTLTGGSGNDIFRFGAMDTRARMPVFDTQGDVVTDFRRGQDTLDLSLFRDAFGATPPASVFLGTDAFVDGTSFQVRYAVLGTDTRVEIFAPVFTLPGPPVLGNASFTLTGVHLLTAADFILV